MRRNKGSVFLAHELSVAGRVASHLPLPFATQVAAQAFLDNKYTTGDTFRLTARKGGGGDTTITAA